MIFLIEYNKKTGTLVRFESFQEAERAQVDAERLKIELSLAGVREPHEVVVLEALDETSLRRTHSRYFKNSSELTASATSVIDTLGEIERK